jgi:hypothetical protein
LRRTVDEIPREIVDEVILTDDASRDTFDLALGLELGLITIRHDRNCGYFGLERWGPGQVRVSCRCAGGKTAAGSVGTTRTAAFE